MTRDERKRLYQAYVDAAHKLIGRGNMAYSVPNGWLLRLRVEETCANVQMVEDGAFVDCTLFVPKELLGVIK